MLSNFGTKNAGLHQSVVLDTGVITHFCTRSAITLSASASYQSGTHLTDMTFLSFDIGFEVDSQPVYFHWFWVQVVACGILSMSFRLFRPSSMSSSRSLDTRMLSCVSCVPELTVMLAWPFTVMSTPVAVTSRGSPHVVIVSLFSFAICSGRRLTE